MTSRSPKTTITVATVPDRYAEIGDPWAGMDDAPGGLDALLELAKRLGPAEKPPKGEGRRTQTMPLIEIARSKTREESMTALEHWKQRHPAAAGKLEPADVLVDELGFILCPRHAVAHMWCQAGLSTCRCKGKGQRG